MRLINSYNKQMKKLNIVLRFLVMILLIIFLCMWGLAGAGSHNIPPRTSRTLAATVIGLLVIFTILQIKSSKK